MRKIFISLTEDPILEVTTDTLSVNGNFVKVVFHLDGKKTQLLLSKNFRVCRSLSEGTYLLDPRRDANNDKYMIDPSRGNPRSFDKKAYCEWSRS